MTKSPSDNPAFPLSARAWAAAICAAAVLVFAGTLSNPFVFDDVVLIRDNPIIQESGRALEAFTSDYWSMQAASDAFRDRLYRPLTVLTLILNHLLGGNAPAGYRVLNILLHAAASLALFGLAIRFGMTVASAGAVALLFALHPVHTESVNAVVGRADLLAAVAVFAGIYLLLGEWVPFSGDEMKQGRGRRRSGKGKKIARNPVTRRAEGFQNPILIGVLVLIALLAKEIGTALFLWAAIWWMWKKAGGESPRAGGRTFWRMMGVMTAAIALYLAMRYSALGMMVRPGPPSLLDNPLAHTGAGGRLLGAFEVLGRYFRVLIWPWPLAADRSFAQIVPDGPMTWAWAAAGVGILAAWAISGWRWRSSRPEVAFGLTLFVAAFFPVSNLLFPIGTVMAERLMYLPSAGVLIAAVPVAAGSLERVSPKGAPALLIAIGMLFAGMTWARNRVWADSLVFWKETARVSPRSARARRLYGKILYEKGRASEAIPPLRESIRIYPKYEPTWVDLGNALALAGQEKGAVDAFRRALEIRPGSVTAGFGLGQLYVRRGNLEKARPYMERAVSRAPHWMEARFILGNIYMADGQWRLAVTQFEAALKLSPRSAPVHHNMAIALVTLGDRKGALRHAREAIRLGMRLHPTLARELGLPGS